MVPLNQHGEAARAFLLANELKPREGESFSSLCGRAKEALVAFDDGDTCIFMLTERDERRARRYGDLYWRLTTLDLAEVTVWPGMSRLDPALTEGSVLEVAERLQGKQLPHEVERLSRLLRLSDEIGVAAAIEWMTLLPLLGMPDGVLHQRVVAPLQYWTLDDGCARSVALATLGVTSVRAYVGEPRR
jgi:hypothetical protein